MKQLQQSIVWSNMLNAFATSLQKRVCEAPQSRDYGQPDAVHCEHNKMASKLSMN